MSGTPPTLSSRRELLFCYDIKMGNPNGDPDENRPRVLPDKTHYVNDVRLKRFVRDFLKTQGRPVYNLDILKPRDEEGEGADMQMPSGKSDDDMYDKAVYIVTTTRNASISWVQRQLRIGYNRAARIVEEMEKQGVVSAPDHTNKREVLVAHA